MKRSKHSLSHYRLMTGDMGKLYPVGCVETLPGDTFQQSSSCLLRVSPLVAPVMHPVQVRFHHFFVPSRILWDGFEKFITGDNDDPIPTVTTTADSNILDYLGVPPVAGIEVNALPVRAYNKIFNEFYRDQDLVSEVAEDSLALQNVAWGKDYFTAARPWPQKGDDVTIPIGATAPVIGDGNQVIFNSASGDHNGVIQSDGNLSSTNPPGGSDEAMLFSSQTGLMADLSLATGANVNDVRRAFALQRYQEARARYGSRYTEYLRYLGVKPSDGRLQRPEYLGGGKQTIAFSEVLQHVDDDTGLERGPLGKMAGHGIASLRTNRYRKFFEEHGYVITLMSIRPKSIYTQNLHRKWLRSTKEDFYQKELEQIGQQEVFNNEIYAVPDADNTGYDTFGYSDRYQDYREEPSTVSGEFRNILDYWHLARDFESAPVLNESFVNCEPSKRIYAEQTQHALWIMVNHSIQARRMVRKNATARII